MDEKQFVEKYNFDNLKMVTIVNPTSEDFTFGITMETSVDISNGQMKSETKQYVVRAGDKERLPGVAANLYLDQISKKIAQEEDRFALYPDFAERAKYYDDLIVEVEDMLGSFQSLPQYTDVEEDTADEQEKPFETIKETPNEQPQATGKGTPNSTKGSTERASTTSEQKK